tara:strand:+ start:138 stop:278 length:141 start_codon:yes stop_codon:yes gene_type:complete
MADDVFGDLRSTFEEVAALGTKLEALANQGLQQIVNATRSQKRRAR